ncbi:MAG TPA: rRNA adenine N(6)-methyltransferase family protein [Gaiellaceae bacterium]|nr:rRNA adenine N(6)-methyltransferase family protein [Gaiellaceae bacterium]
MADRRARGARRSPPRSRHFLRRGVAAQIVRDACIRHDELVVDLGAGSGRLTAELSRVARAVVAVELDPRLAAGLCGRWPNVGVVEGDAARVALPRSPFRVVANLPFHRTADLLHRLLDDPYTPLTRADLVVEWGVAFKRAVPWPSSVSGVVWGAFYEMSLARRLPRTSFEPPPSVDAGVLVVRRRERPLVPPERVGDYHRFVADGFRHGRVGRPARELDAYEWADRFRRR